MSSHPPSTAVSIGRSFGVAFFGVDLFNTMASQPHLQAAKSHSALETKVSASTLSLENVVSCKARKRF
jgi:hypothetical protein